MQRQALLAAALLALSGCAATSRRQESAGLAAMRTVSDYRSTSYRLAPADLVSVSVYPDPRLNRKARVEADGAISLPLIGTTTVTGATILEAESRLESRLAKYLVNPHVTLVVEEYGNRQMFVLGEVHSPGSYPIPAGARMTVLQAISTAGGFTKVAAPRKARLLRYVNGHGLEREIDLRAIARGGESGKDLVLEPNDIVYVPQSVF